MGYVGRERGDSAPGAWTPSAGATRLRLARRRVIQNCDNYPPREWPENVTDPRSAKPIWDSLRRGRLAHGEDGLRSSGASSSMPGTDKIVGEPGCEDARQGHAAAQRCLELLGAYTRSAAARHSIGEWFADRAEALEAAGLSE